MRMYSLSINDNPYDVIIKDVSGAEVRAEVNGVEHLVSIREIKNIAPEPILSPEAPSQLLPEAAFPSKRAAATPLSSGNISSPIPGHIIDIFVQEGEKVLAGQKLLVLEAMKLENVITSDHDGTVRKIMVQRGEAVTHDQLLIVVE